MARTAERPEPKAKRVATERNTARSRARAVRVEQRLRVAEDAASQRLGVAEGVDRQLEAVFLHESRRRRQGQHGAAHARAGARFLRIAAKRLQQPRQPQDLLDVRAGIVNPEEAGQPIHPLFGVDEGRDPGGAEIRHPVQVDQDAVPDLASGGLDFFAKVHRRVVVEPSLNRQLQQVSLRTLLDLHSTSFTIWPITTRPARARPDRLRTSILKGNEWDATWRGWPRSRFHISRAAGSGWSSARIAGAAIRAPCGKGREHGETAHPFDTIQAAEPGHPARR